MGARQGGAGGGRVSRKLISVGDHLEVFEEPPPWGKAWFVPLGGSRGPFLADEPRCHTVQFPDWDHEYPDAFLVTDLVRSAIKIRTFKPTMYQMGGQEWCVWYEGASDR